MIEAADIEQIRQIIVEGNEKTERQIDGIKREIVDDIKELSRKFDEMGKTQGIFAERITKIEVSQCILEESRKEQGKRLGDCEQKLAVMKGSQTGIEKEKANAKDWAKWVVPLVISALMALFTVLYNLLK